MPDLTRIDDTGTEQPAANVQPILSDGTLADATAVEKVMGDGSLQVVWQPFSGYNLVHEVPDDAWDLYQSFPSDWSTYYGTETVGSAYDNRGDDLAVAIEAAASNDNLLDIGTGTYEMETDVSVGSGTNVGVVGDGATIYYTGTSLTSLFNGGGTNFVLDNLTFDISETTSGGFDSDVGVTDLSASDEVWIRDVILSGERNRFQDLDGDGTKDAVGRLYNFRCRPTNSGATVFYENVTMLDGEVNHDDIADPDTGDFAGSIPFSVEVDAEGFSVFKECSVRYFCDNAFYVSNSGPNRNVIWDCYAADCRGGLFRFSERDEVIGGTLEAVDVPTNRICNPLYVDVKDASNQTNDERAVGVEITGSDGWNELVRTVSDTTYVEFDRLQITADTHDNRIFRFVGNSADVHIVDCDIDDQRPSGADLALYVRSDSEVITSSDDLRLHSANADEVYLEHSDSRLHIDGDTYFGPDTTLTDGNLGLADHEFPNLYFDEGERS